MSFYEQFRQLFHISEPILSKQFFLLEFLSSGLGSMVSKNICKLRHKLKNAKNVRTTFQCIFVLQVGGEGPENLSRIGPIVMCLFMTFSPWLENNDTSKCSYDSFAHTLIYVVNVENCQDYIEVYQCSPITGRRS